MTENLEKTSTVLFHCDIKSKKIINGKIIGSLLLSSNNVGDEDQYTTLLSYYHDLLVSHLNDGWKLDICLSENENTTAHYYCAGDALAYWECLSKYDPPQVQSNFKEVATGIPKFVE